MKKLDPGVKAALIGAVVTVILSVAALLGRNTTLLNEHEIRLNDTDNNIRTLIAEFLKTTQETSAVAQRVAHLEGRLKGAPPLTHTDSRGPR